MVVLMIVFGIWVHSVILDLFIVELVSPRSHGMSISLLEIISVLFIYN